MLKESQQKPKAKRAQRRLASPRKHLCRFCWWYFKASPAACGAHIHKHTHTHIYIYIHLYIYIYTFIYIYTPLYIHIYTFIYTYIYIYMYIHLIFFKKNIHIQIANQIRKQTFELRVLASNQGMQNEASVRIVDKTRQFTWIVSVTGLFGQLCSCISQSSAIPHLPSGYLT